MAARRASFDKKRARIAALAREPRPAAIAELRRFLDDKSGYLAGEAAKVAEELDARELAPGLAAAMARLMKEGAAADKGCLGKTRILEAMLTFEAFFPEVYLEALRYVQMEPAFPKAADTALAIRGRGAHALVQIDHREALYAITPLLADEAAMVRAEAARALARSGIEAACAPLHLKALQGDPEADVLQACFEGLLRLAPTRYLPFVAEALQGSEAQMDAAALALGQSRLKEAFPLLQRALSSADGPRERQSLAMALGLMRSDEANRHLLSLVADAPDAVAIAALDGLSLSRHDEAIRTRVEELVSARGSKRVEEALRERFR